MKSFFRTHRYHILSAAVILGVLALAFFWGGDLPEEDAPVSLDVTEAPLAPTEAPKAATQTPTEEASEAATEAPSASPSPAATQDAYHTDPVPSGVPLPVEPQTAEVTDEKNTCTLSIRCDTALRHASSLSPEKAAVLPQDGVIFPPTRVTFYEGESVFNLLLRETKRNKIHMEFVNTPIYNSAYIEGIGNLYEFDCGELSGWMYKVNGAFPNYGCSRYQLKTGDVVEWVYTCDLGSDVGDTSGARNGK